MKKANLIKGVAVLSVITMVGGGVIAAQAANNNSNALFGGRGKGKNIEKRVDLTAEQKAEMEAKMTAVRTALANKDYNAWVIAVKAMDADCPMLSKVTADNFAEYAAKEAGREAKMTEQKNKMEAVRTALTNGDYSAWVSAVNSQNPNSPLLTKITASNFASYVQAHQLREQADTILKNLGIEGNGMGMGMGLGERGHGGAKGMGFGGMMGEGRGHNGNFEAGE